ncbi:Carbonic anhydrase-related protein 10 [Eumeta japonica]|uniref:Carbonic anhydrase-related protein 10 n=1 Tax=Eumeta variegata TaxID=151549 RepID=A0A4C1Z3M0_EUMVA|nr:Carbonic anhydrase-related protein 10 [Eumeta japonica]
MLQLHALRRLMQGDARHPKAPLGNNFRPPQPLHHRAVRTNIDFDLRKYPGKTCPSMHRNMHYKGLSPEGAKLKTAFTGRRVRLSFTQVLLKLHASGRLDVCTAPAERAPARGPSSRALVNYSSVMYLHFLVDSA